MGGYDKKQARGVFGLHNLPLTRGKAEETSGEIGDIILANAVIYGDATLEKIGKHWTDHKYWPTDAFLADWAKDIELRIAEEKKYLKHVRTMRRKLARKAAS